MSLVNLAQELETAGYGTRGQNIFVGVMPADETEGIFLRQFGGGVDPDLYTLRELSFQMAVRSKDYATGLQKAEDASRALILRHKVIGDAHFYFCMPRHEPFPTGREASGIYTFVVNLDAKWRKL